MNTYEFSTKVSNGTVVIPQEYAEGIPHEREIRVILVIDDIAGSKDQNENGEPLASSQSLQELVAEIQRTPSKPENIVPASGLLAEHLANSAAENDTDFDEEAWNQQWAAIEAEMKANSLSHEQDELKKLSSL